MQEIRQCEFLGVLKPVGDSPLRLKKESLPGLYLKAKNNKYTPNKVLRG